MRIRKTRFEDIDYLLDIFEKAREFMSANGNPTQWPEGHPSRALIENDISEGKSYVCVEDDEVLGTFYYSVEPEETYDKIYQGDWLDEETYGVIHRITTGASKSGAGRFCIEWCLEDCGNLRIDTHRDNVAMHNLLMKMGFTECGLIYIENGDERIAYQKRTL